MKASGQLVFAANNYAIPDPNASPKRGRGRPAKPKELVPEGTVVATPMVSGQKRGRGRPPKRGKKKVAAAPVLLPSGERRGRGRPRKTPVAAAPVGA
nr:HMG-Y-related protein B-like [Tanacetum cinerariifolium]